MEVFVDGNRRAEFELMDGDALPIVGAISEQLRQEGQALVALAVDGQNLSPEEVVVALQNKRAGDLARIEAQSEATSSLVATCLEELEQVLPELPSACHGLAEIFQSDAPEQGYEPFQQLAGAWENIKQREIQVANAMGVALESLVIEGVPFTKVHQDLAVFLQEAADAIESQDGVLLGDLLEYELAPRAESEASIIAALRSEAEKLFKS